MFERLKVKPAIQLDSCKKDNFGRIDRESCYPVSHAILKVKPAIRFHSCKTVNPAIQSHMSY